MSEAELDRVLRDAGDDFTLDQLHRILAAADVITESFFAWAYGPGGRQALLAFANTQSSGGGTVLWTRATGRWSRVRLCDAETCRRAFYDKSSNLCGR
jgi:hypothetical protein